MYHLLSNWNFQNVFVNGKQPLSPVGNQKPRLASRSYSSLPKDRPIIVAVKIHQRPIELIDEFFNTGKILYLYISFVTITSGKSSGAFGQPAFFLAGSPRTTVAFEKEVF